MVKRKGVHIREGKRNASGGFTWPGNQGITSVGPKPRHKLVHWPATSGGRTLILLLKDIMRNTSHHRVSITS